MGAIEYLNELVEIQVDVKIVTVTIAKYSPQALLSRAEIHIDDAMGVYKSLSTMLTDFNSETLIKVGSDIHTFLLSIPFVNLDAVTLALHDITKTVTGIQELGSTLKELYSAGISDGAKVLTAITEAPVLLMESVASEAVRVTGSAAIALNDAVDVIVSQNRGVTILNQSRSDFYNTASEEADAWSEYYTNFNTRTQTAIGYGNALEG